MVLRMLSWLGLRKPKPAPTPELTQQHPNPASAEPHPPEPTHELGPEPAASQPDPAAHHGAAEPNTPAPPGADTIRTQLEGRIAEARFAEAETLFAQLPPDLDQDWYVRAGLTLARRRADHPQTLAYATRLQASPSSASPLAYSAASQASRALGRPQEALAVAEAGLNRFPKAVGLLQEAAQAAEAAGNTDRAYTALAALRAAQPKSAEGHIRAVQLSIRKRQPEITRTLLEEGLAAFPNDRNLRHAAARRAVGHQSWSEAAAHWTVLTARFPDDAPLALEAAVSLIGPRPGRPERLPQVFAQLAALRQRFPDFAPAYAAEITALREAGRFDEAEAKGQPWRQRFPVSQDLAIACARVAEEQGRPGEAAAMLEAARAHTAPNPLLEAAYIRSLSLAGEDEAAEHAADAALARFPQDIRIAKQHVALAAHRGDRADAAARASRLARQFPRNAALAQLARSQQTSHGAEDQDKTAHAP